MPSDAVGGDDAGQSYLVEMEFHLRRNVGHISGKNVSNLRERGDAEFV
jgi:hypothetical protein